MFISRHVTRKKRAEQLPCWQIVHLLKIHFEWKGMCGETAKKSVDRLWRIKNIRIWNSDTYYCLPVKKPFRTEIKQLNTYPNSMSRNDNLRQHLNVFIFFLINLSLKYGSGEQVSVFTQKNITNSLEKLTTFKLFLFFAFNAWAY